MFPIMVELQDQKVVVVGGGRVAYHKIQNILRFNVHVDVVSPEFHDGILQLAEQKKVTLHQKEVEYEDYQDAFLVIAVTNSKSVNEQVAKTANHLVVNAENPELGNSIIPASLIRGKLMISISTGGASPTLSKQLRNQLAHQFDDSYESYLDFLYEVRRIVKSKSIHADSRKRLLQEVVQPIYLESVEEREMFLRKLEE
ncbi:NAD(P)-binding protein [Rossellomorea sp. BNER]|uniref:NAD(P)-binding protein n=1 Tax=Rossellomorea sp. BNER TaxID=2962031 RepID=UPI003AF1F658|nr:NAD(P)-binding protein [Rossellomorea sp. BNER]